MISDYIYFYLNVDYLSGEYDDSEYKPQGKYFLTN